MNPESLESSIQGALSALFPPFEATAPIVLSQLFRTIEEHYHGDALQCLLDFLIPSKHLLESVQQAACAGFCDVVFRCEGWPLCLHDKTVIQLAPINPLLLRPGDFYLQVEPFGEQAARIVLKSLLEEGCREVEETPVPETSYPCIFTEDWLQELNEGRHGTPLSRCLVSTDQGVIKLPWAEIAVPEFLEKPKIMPTYQKPHPEPKKISFAKRCNSFTLPLEAVVPPKDRMSASLRPVDYSSKLVRMDHEKRNAKSFSKPLMKPVGWVSPNTWDRPNYPEVECDYVDLVDLAKRKEAKDQTENVQSNPVLFKPVRSPPPVPAVNGVYCGATLQFPEEPCTPCNKRKLGYEPTEEDLKCRYRDSYMAALNNPVTFEKGSVDLLAALEEVSLCEETEPSASSGVKPELTEGCEDSKDAMCNKQCNNNLVLKTPERCPAESADIMKESPVVLKSTPGLSYSHKVQTKMISHESLHHVSVHQATDDNLKPQKKVEDERVKHKVKVRSLSTVSDTPQGSPLSYKLNNRSHSDICPETINDIMQRRQQEVPGPVTPKLERWKLLRKDGADGRLQALKVDTFCQPASVSSGSPKSPQSPESSFKSVCGLLQLGIICLPGSRDRTGRAVVEVHCDREVWTSPLVTAQNLCELLLYLHSIPSKDVRELGMTLVINARRKGPPPHLYKALLMAQEQALHAVHCVVMLVEKDTFPRPEKQPGLQMDMVTSMKALNKTVEASQLTSGLGGSFVYSHADWLQFQQRLVSFMNDLQGADSLLQRAIMKMEGSPILDTPQEVQSCIQAQRTLMKEVLEDSRLVTLQREGGAVLARMRREEFRFPQSEDYRDALEAVTILYNQVEEKVHTLVMRSNESSQSLEVLFKLREMEAKISSTGTWFNTEGEQRLKDSCPTDESFSHTEKAFQVFDQFLQESKAKQQSALNVVRDAERLVGHCPSSPAADIFRTLVNTFKCNLEDFMLRAQQRHKELDTLVHVFRFCDQASSLAKECSQFLENLEQRCEFAQADQSTLKMYEERLGGEFSTSHFQVLKSKACAVRSGATGAMKVWNAAWMQCQGVRQRLEKILRKNKKKSVDKTQKTAAVNTPTAVGAEKEEEESRGSKTESSLAQLLIPEPSSDSTCAKRQSEPLFKEEVKQQAAAPSLMCQSSSTQNGPCHLKRKSRRRRSESDLTTEADSRGHRPLRRSLSEGSCDISHLKVGFSIPAFNKPRESERTLPLQVKPQNIQDLPSLPQQSLHSEHSSCKSRPGSNELEGGPAAGRSTSTQSPMDPNPPETLLIPPEDHGSNAMKLRRIMEELLTTEREYVKALGYVREHYFPELERADVPQDLRGQRGSIFGNLEKLHDFHRHHFLSELESCFHEPLRVGRCFLRHKENFALYALYSKNKPQSDSLLINHGQAFFKQKQLRLGDKMDLWSYLLKPVQRISKYSLLLQDMMRECGPKQARELLETKAALEVVHFQLRHGNNLLAMDAILNCDVNLKEQGQLIRQDEFLVTFRKKKCYRHIFLFRDLILFSKTRKTDVGNDTYLYKQSFKTSDVGLTQNCGETGLCFEIWFRKRKTQDTYTLQAPTREVKEAWTKDLERILWEQAVHNREVRMQERVFMGIGNKPFMDIQPSDAAISDRAVNYVLLGRENRIFPSLGLSGSPDVLSGARPKSVSRSTSSSSSSSGRGSLSPGYICLPKQRAMSGELEGYVSPFGILEEDDMDHAPNLLYSSESSGESVSGFSSSGHSYVEREAEDCSPVCGAAAHRGDAHAAAVKLTVPVGSRPLKHHVNLSTGKVQPKVKDTNLGKSTEV
ncbi:quattro isoform 2-T2 [Synchiropus picturatus]